MLRAFAALSWLDSLRGWGGAKLGDHISVKHSGQGVDVAADESLSVATMNIASNVLVSFDVQRVHRFRGVEGLEVVRKKVLGKGLSHLLSH